MTGELMIHYIVLCEGDLDISIPLAELLEHETVVKAIKNIYAKGKRDIEMLAAEAGSVRLKNSKTVQSVTIAKDDFMDALTLAEEDAKAKKLLKKGCEQVEIVDIQTV